MEDRQKVLWEWGGERGEVEDLRRRWEAEEGIDQR